jgi:hypothetical protein
MPKTVLLLRLASLVALIEFLGHTAMFVSYVPSHGPAEVAVVDAMKSHTFSFGGSPHTYWELYFGYGLFVSVGCFTEAVLLWMTATIAKTNPAQVKPMVAMFALSEIAFALLIRRYFFTLPLIAHLTAAACLIAAYLSSIRPECPGTPLVSFQSAFSQGDRP